MKFYLVLLFLLSSFFVVGQSHLFENNTSGFSLQGFLLPERGAPIFNITPGYVHNGRWSVNLVLGRRFSKDVNFNSIGISPSVSCLILKQGLNNKILNLNLRSYCQYVNFIDYDDIVSFSIGLGATINHQIDVNEKLKLYPGFTIWRGASIFRINNEFEGELISGTSYILSFSTAFKNYFIEPNYALSENGGSFRLKFGIIFPK